LAEQQALRADGNAVATASPATVVEAEAFTQQSPLQLSQAQAPPVSHAQPAATQLHSVQTHEAPQQQPALACVVATVAGARNEAKSIRSQYIKKLQLEKRL
jgi:hypothetical protein